MESTVTVPLAVAPNAPLLLKAVGLTKRFVGTIALEDVSFDLRPGEVHCLVGENGAGKSTLIKILTAAHRQDSGQIFVNGEDVSQTSVRAP
jgi:monosaccharide-transporting ATPase